MNARNIALILGGLGIGVVVTNSLLSVDAARVQASVDYNAAVSHYCASVGNTLEVNMAFNRTGDGKNMGGRVVRFPLSGPVVDGDGQQLWANTPKSLAIARSDFEAALSSAMDSAASGGKLNP